MIPTDFSVLLLAWDDADPAVVVLGGSALPPTLPLVYQLAAQHPVLALYPHLPAAEATAALETPAPVGSASAGDAEAALAAGMTGAAAGAGATDSAAAAVTADSAEAFAAAGPLGVVADVPGVHLLPAAAGHGEPAAPAGSSRLVGLDDWQPAIANALPPARSLTNAPEATTGAGGPLAPAKARSQWPTSSGPWRAMGGQVPAVPYAGAAGPADATYGTASQPFSPPPPPAPPRPAAAVPASPAAGAPPETPATPAALATPAVAAATQAASVAASAAVGSGSETVLPAHFDEPVEEIGAAEARDLDAPEDDLVPDAAPSATTTDASETAATTTAPESTTAWTVRQPTLDGLNFRMIQYARRAAQLVAGRHDFGVIYAPAWPAWLAALEIRNRSGRPLVLYVPALASATAPTADRGWLLGLERMTLRRATLVLVPDAEVLRQLRASHDEVPGEVRIVPAADEAAVQQVLAGLSAGYSISAATGSTCPALPLA